MISFYFGVIYLDGVWEGGVIKDMIDVWDDGMFCFFRFWINEGVEVNLVIVVLFGNFVVWVVIFVVKFLYGWFLVVWWDVNELKYDVF